MQQLNTNLSQAFAQVGTLIQRTKGSKAVSPEDIAALASILGLITSGLQQMDQIIKEIEVKITALEAQAKGNQPKKG